jgi:hypothetical protein
MVFPVFCYWVFQFSRNKYERNNFHIKAANPVLCEENWFVEKSLSFLFSDVISCFFSAFYLVLLLLLCFKVIRKPQKRKFFVFSRFPVFMVAMTKHMSDGVDVKS